MGVVDLGRLQIGELQPCCATVITDPRLFLAPVRSIGDLSPAGIASEGAA